MIKGKIHKFGANIDTDAIIPSRYANLTAPEDLGQHCMEGTAPDFSRKVQPGDIIYLNPDAPWWWRRTIDRVIPQLLMFPYEELVLKWFGQQRR